MKIYVSLALKLFCGEIQINNKSLLKQKGPLLVTANHPNSFFDAIIIATLFRTSIYFLARGDVFKNKTIAAILNWLRIIPIHRISEGSENLHLNEATFQRCREIFSNNGIVLIFIEGLSQHEFTLRPFKKGAARLALSSWVSISNESNLKVMPLGLTYNHFDGIGKRVTIMMKEPESSDDFEVNDSGKAILFFNERMFREISDLIMHSHKPLSTELNKLAKLLLFLPAATGYIMHAPLYLTLKAFVKKKTEGTVFFDSVLFALLMILYPFYLTLLIVIFYFFSKSAFSLLAFITVPLFARAAVVHFANRQSATK